MGLSSFRAWPRGCVRLGYVLAEFECFLWVWCTRYFLESFGLVEINGRVYVMVWVVGLGGWVGLFFGLVGLVDFGVGFVDSWWGVLPAGFGCGGGLI